METFLFVYPQIIKGFLHIIIPSLLDFAQQNPYLVGKSEIKYETNIPISKSLSNDLQ